LAKIREHTLDDMLRAPDPLIVIAAGIQDPGNLGTIIRSAEALGATGLVVIEGTVNPFNPKVIRGSAGSVFRLPLIKSPSSTALCTIRDKGLRILATSSHKSIPLSEADLTGPLAIIIGNEGSGVPRELLSQAEQSIGVPHSPKVESLNAGIAASVVLYECARQRS
jgi:TrmH family RNA methyltransferase